MLKKINPFLYWHRVRAPHEVNLAGSVDGVGVGGVADAVHLVKLVDYHWLVVRNRKLV